LVFLICLWFERSFSLAFEKDLIALLLFFLSLKEWIGCLLLLVHLVFCTLAIIV
jgi:hypothetical protein